MTQRQRYRCRSCGHRFEADTLTDAEQREVRRKNQPLYPIVCPKCSRNDVRRGWD